MTDHRPLTRVVNVAWGLVAVAVVGFLFVVTGRFWLIVVCGLALVFVAFLALAEWDDHKQRRKDAELARRVKGRVT